MTTNEPPGSDGRPTNAAADASTVARRRPFQFSMATGLVVVTGLSIVLSLTLWQPVLGGMLSSLIVGSGWSYAAIRAGRRKLAYYLAAWPMGVGAFVVGCLPFGWGMSMERDLVPLLTMCFAAIVAFGLLRPLIRKPGLGASVSAGVLAVYTTAAIFWVFACLCVGIASVVTGDGEAVDRLLSLACIGVMASVIWATMVMPVAGPLGVWFCTILRRIDPENTDVEERAPTPE